jgi:hypothetical protein
MKQDIVNRNHKGQLHGYQERYSDTTFSTILYRGCFSNNTFIGYQELYIDDPHIVYYIV